MPHNFYDTLNRFFECEKPTSVLNIAKACGEIFVERVPALYEIQTDLYFIEEPLINSPLVGAVLEKYKFFEPKYLSFDNFVEDIKGKEYDFFIVDTVHYSEYLDYLLKNTIKQCRRVAFFHDADPMVELVFPKRTEDIPWSGLTYNSLYNFYLANPTLTKLVRDMGQGYAVIRSGEFNLDYPTPMIDIKEFKRLDIFTPHTEIKC